jgi:hypothetical protein
VGPGPRAGDSQLEADREVVPRELEVSSVMSVALEQPLVLGLGFVQSTTSFPIAFALGGSLVGAWMTAARSQEPAGACAFCEICSAGPSSRMKIS